MRLSYLIIKYKIRKNFFSHTLSEVVTVEVVTFEVVTFDKIISLRV